MSGKAGLHAHSYRARSGTSSLPQGGHSEWIFNKQGGSSFRRSACLPRLQLSTSEAAMHGSTKAVRTRLWEHAPLLSCDLPCVYPSQPAALLASAKTASKRSITCSPSKRRPYEGKVEVCPILWHVFRNSRLHVE